MSGTRSPSRTAHPTDGAIEGRWPVWKLGLLLYPFTAATVAINLFLLGLILKSADWTDAISPVQSLLWALPLSLPATWAAARWVRSMIREAEGRDR